MTLLDKKIYFIGGKGGVGKSTTSAAMALLLSKSGKKVLLVSTDPAHNTGDLFHADFGGGKIVKAAQNLDVLEIDSERESRNYINGVKGNLKGLVKATMIEEVNRQIDMAASSPGAEEAALFDRITSLILEEIRNYDAIVFDTAPTGHTIRLLTLPELMGVWMDGLLERRKKVNENYAQWMNDGEVVEDPLYEKLNERKNRFKKVREILLDHAQTEYIFVLNAERLPILETAKAIETLHKHSIHVNTIVVNKVIPDEADGNFMAQRKANEGINLNEIKNKFRNLRQVFLPLLEQDISSLKALEQVSLICREQIEKLHMGNY
ncbi:ArsA family ATPase [Mesobacillus subterraneus]|uniref:ArsA family ATPase n=1 Tax=Mesobacillus subterraneus TaxID=285983 RepID=UPI002040B979|nr:ArsA family ATPase [Mesobacillus subterraneus]MCM3664748.1 ArsA family ATPase [Mesobacillus subterraneus]MCM3681837.1 ArsA family ATPase [Mesobacillus subterraneus]